MIVPITSRTISAPDDITACSCAPAPTVYINPIAWSKLCYLLFWSGKTEFCAYGVTEILPDDAYHVTDIHLPEQEVEPISVVPKFPGKVHAALMEGTEGRVGLYTHIHSHHELPCTHFSSADENHSMLNNQLSILLTTGGSPKAVAEVTTKCGGRYRAVAAVHIASPDTVAEIITLKEEFDARVVKRSVVVVKLPKTQKGKRNAKYIPLNKGIACPDGVYQSAYGAVVVLDAKRYVTLGHRKWHPVHKGKMGKHQITGGAIIDTLEERYLLWLQEEEYTNTV